MSSLESNIIVLCFEKNETTIRKIKEKLETSGLDFEIGGVRNIEDFTSALRHIRFDVIVADYGLSHEEGKCALDIAKKIVPNAPFIYISDIEDNKTILIALEAGAAQFIHKNNLDILPLTIKRSIEEVRERVENKRIRFLLEESEEKYEKLIQSVPDVVYRIDNEGYFLFVSDSIKNFGYEPEDLIGKHFSVLLHEKDAPNVSREMVLPGFKGIETGDEKAPKLFDERRTGKRMTKNLEIRLNPETVKNKNILKKNKDSGLQWVEVFSSGDYLETEEDNKIKIEKNEEKETIWIEISAAGEYFQSNKENQLLGTVGLIRDISERKKLQMEFQEILSKLKNSNEELKQFAYVASHDLREPLRMISSFLDLIKRKIESHYQQDEDMNEYIQYAVDGAHRMEDFINALLRLSRIETHGSDFQQTDLKSVFEKATDNLRIKIEENQAFLKLESLPVVLADSSQMIQLFQNLIENALKYRRKDIDPVVHIFSSETESEYQITVQDNGIGIQKEYFDRIFIVFQRLHTREEYEGNGIGLAMCKKIIERHRGKIWVENGENGGARFIFTLPKE